MTLLERCKSIAKKKLLENNHGKRYKGEHHLGNLKLRHDQHNHKGRVANKLAEDGGGEDREKASRHNPVNTDPKLEKTIALDR